MNIFQIIGMKTARKTVQFENAKWKSSQLTLGGCHVPNSHQSVLPLQPQSGRWLRRFEKLSATLFCHHHNTPPGKSRQSAASVLETGRRRWSVSSDSDRPCGDSEARELAQFERISSSSVVSLVTDCDWSGGPLPIESDSSLTFKDTFT